MYVYNPRNKSNSFNSSLGKRSNSYAYFSTQKTGSISSLVRPNSRNSRIYSQKSHLRSSKNQSPFSGFSNIFSSTLVVQIFALFILSVALLLSFQSLTDVSTTDAFAKEGIEQVRIYNNFQQTKTSSERDQNQFITKNIQVVSNTSLPLQTQTVVGQYVVKEGDTLESVAATANISATKLSSINNIAEENQLKPGDIIKVSE